MAMLLSACGSAVYPEESTWHNKIPPCQEEAKERQRAGLSLSLQGPTSSDLKTPPPHVLALEEHPEFKQRQAPSCTRAI